jgi:hypothetical protein
MNTTIEILNTPEDIECVDVISEGNNKVLNDELDILEKCMIDNQDDDFDYMMTEEFINDQTDAFLRLRGRK